MPIVDYAALPEFQMRAGIKGKWYAGREHGSSSVSLLWNRVEPDASVPRHFHEYEEIILVEEGRIWTELEGERSIVSRGRAVIIPPNKVHAWGNAGPGEARVMFVWPVLEPFSPGKSTYVEGAPPKVA